MLYIRMIDFLRLEIFEGECLGSGADHLTI